MGTLRCDCRFDLARIPDRDEGGSKGLLGSVERSLASFGFFGNIHKDRNIWHRSIFRQSNGICGSPSLDSSIRTYRIREKASPLDRLAIRDFCISSVALLVKRATCRRQALGRWDDLNI